MCSICIWVSTAVNSLMVLTIALTIRKLEFTQAENIEQDESKSSKDSVMSLWPFIAGAAIIVIFLLVVILTMCCIWHKQNKEPYYANTESQPVRDTSKNPIIYENDQEFTKKISKGKRQLSSVYINRPENKVAIYVNSRPTTTEEDTYANCSENDYENVK